MIDSERMESEPLADPHSATMQAAPSSGASAAHELAPGTLIAGKYLVEGTIGTGGLGVVVKARHMQLEQPVAIKYLKRLDVSRPDVVERFVREARLAARIKNEHAVKVYDVDTLDNGVPYIVMELLEGRDLESILRDGPLSLHDAIDYVLQASQALAEAHAIGIVHRDVKPANLFLAERPGGASIVKVLDFGISKITTKAGQPGRREKQVTLVDERLGTPVYMSPEQLEATDVDARADIWALGVVLHELLTKAVPFGGDDLTQLFVAILQHPPVPLRVVLPDAPLALEAIILRCLQKERGKRYRNIAELAQDLAEVWEGELPSRVQEISRMIRAAGHSISPPTPFPGSLKLPLAPAVPVMAPAPTPLPVAVDDRVIAVFCDATGASIDEMQFLSLDEAYEYACSLGSEIERVDMYDEFADVRGKLRVTYVRKSDSEHWVPMLT
jgi:eukaryotic-like serine/threonine-protein kinase